MDWKEGDQYALQAVVEPAQSELKQALQDIAFGSVSIYLAACRAVTEQATQVAGVIGKYIEYPFDTIKVRLQSQPSGSPAIYSGPLDCFRQSITRDGILGLYRGISAPLAGAAIETSSLFFSVGLASVQLKARSADKK